MTLIHRRLAGSGRRVRRRRVSPYEIPTINDYRHHGEQAAEIWWAENRYDMEHPEEMREAYEADHDEDRRYDDPDPFDDSFDTEAEARAFAETLSDSAKSISPWGRPGEERWYVEHYDKEAHKRWLYDV